MKTSFPMNQDTSRIVYVKAVDVVDMPENVQQEAGELDQLYAVHDAQGQQLALVADRRMAFILARENDYSPVPVH